MAPVQSLPSDCTPQGHLEMFPVPKAVWILYKKINRSNSLKGLFRLYGVMWHRLLYSLFYGY